jgi:hypothetical protein
LSSMNGSLSSMNDSLSSMNDSLSSMNIFRRSIKIFRRRMDILLLIMNNLLPSISFYQILNSHKDTFFINMATGKCILNCCEFVRTMIFGIISEL